MAPKKRTAVEPPTDEIKDDQSTVSSVAPSVAQSDVSIPKKRAKKEKKVVDTDTAETTTEVSEVTSSEIAPASEVVVTKKEKKKRKPNKKKGIRAPSSYVLFSMEYRKEVSSQFPELSLGEVSKKCGEAWSALSSEVQAEWKAKSDALKAEKNAHLTETEVPKKKRKPSSYLCFSMEHRKKVIEEEPNLSLGDVSKKCGAAWKNLSDEEKETWKKKAAEL